jgi:hypothetical protein
VDFGLFGLGAFLEAGIVPRVVEVAGAGDQTIKIFEGRIGAYWD